MRFVVVAEYVGVVVAEYMRVIRVIDVDIYWDHIILILIKRNIENTDFYWIYQYL
jgi:hypothetical protein